MKKCFLTATFIGLAIGVAGIPIVANSEMTDAFVYRVENPDKITALQIALCNEFKYQSTVTDPDHVGEVDANGDLYPPVPNPENCADFANRKLINWLDTMIAADTSATMMVDIEENVEDITTAKMDILGDSEIVSTTATASTTVE